MKEYNITFIAALFALAFRRALGPRRAYWLTIAGITLYVLLVGADAAVVRAGMMGGPVVMDIALGRRYAAYCSLGRLRLYFMIAACLPPLARSKP